MRYGACTWIFGDEPLATTAARLAASGCDGVELFGDVERYDPAEAKTVLGDHGLAVLSITPGDADPAHPDDAICQRAVDYYLRLLDFAAELGSPIVSCHGAVGRIRPIRSFTEEWGVFVDAVQTIAHRAEDLGLLLAMECLNRYESHLLNTAQQALTFVEAVGSPHVGVLLDAYHMNVEEANLPLAIVQAGPRLFLFHAADSNRQAVGRGHTDFPALLRALHQIGYDGTIIVECTAPGPDPFTPVKGEGWREVVEGYLAESVEWLQMWERRKTE